MISRRHFHENSAEFAVLSTIYRAGSLTPGITLILFTQATAQLKDIYHGLIAPISINPGLLQDVFTGTLGSTRILSQPENFQKTLLISSRFPGGKNYSSRLPGVLDTLHLLTPPTHMPGFRYASLQCGNSLKCCRNLVQMHIPQFIQISVPTQPELARQKSITVKPLMLACSLFHEPNKTANIKGANINCRPKWDEITTVFRIVWF